MPAFTRVASAFIRQIAARVRLAAKEPLLKGLRNVATKWGYEKRLLNRFPCGHVNDAIETLNRAGLDGRTQPQLEQCAFVGAECGIKNLGQ